MAERAERRLDDRDRAEIVDTLRRRYRDSGYRWHGRVVFVRSPETAAEFLRHDVRLTRYSFAGRVLEQAVHVMWVAWLATLMTGFVLFLWTIGVGYDHGDKLGALIEPFFCLHRWSVVGAVMGAVFVLCFVVGRSDPETWRDDLRWIETRASPAHPMFHVLGGVSWSWSAGSATRSWKVPGPEPAFGSFTYRGLAVVIEPPLVMRTESLPGGDSRLHCDDGAALLWPYGEAYHFLHGTHVPPDLFHARWDADRIGRERNSELRRLAIERMGWQNYIDAAGLQVVGEAPDPGNPGATLRLFDVPDADARVLVMRNGSPDRSGAVRDYAELVPRDCDDPVEAAAWQYGCAVEVYRRLERRT